VGEDQVKEASWVAASVSAISAWLYGTRYPQDKAMEELEQIVAHIKASHG
jgi:hypothetical protein